MNAEKPVLSKTNRNSTSICEDRKPEEFKLNVQPRPHSSGFKSFLNWFKRVEKLQQEQNHDSEDTADDSSSISSGSSTATAASFAFLEPKGYKPFGDALEPKKFITPGPYTETYKNLIKERDRRRDLDKNITLRKKYNLHSSGLTLNGTLKPVKEKSYATNEDVKIYDTFSLPPMSKSADAKSDFPAKQHRRAASETKFVRPHSFVYVKGKRKAPPPPNDSNTLVKRRSTKKRRAPDPPKIDVHEEIQKLLSKDGHNNIGLLHSKSDNNCLVTQPTELSPRPWYKRQLSENKNKEKKPGPEEGKCKKGADRSDSGFFRYSKIFDSKKIQISDSNQAQEKRFSHLLPNISELDREAAELLDRYKKQTREENNNMSNNLPHKNLVSNMSARDIISKMNENSNGDCVSKYSEINPRNVSYRNKVAKSNSDKGKQKNHFIDLQAVDSSTKAIVWKCAQCKKDNDIQRIICFHCYARRPRDASENDSQRNGPCKNTQTSPENEVLKSALEIENVAVKHENEKQLKNNTSKLDKVVCKPSTSKIENTIDEKQKLREILKEMKHSLPKQQKSDRDDLDTKKENVQSYIAIVNVTNKEFTNTKIDDKEMGNNKEIVKLKTNSAAQTDKVRMVNHRINLYENVEQSRETEETKKNEDEANPKVLLKELETAISKGDDKAAADLAKKLAHLKVNCTVLSSADISSNENDCISVNIYIEDQDSHHGPLPIKISKSISISELRRNVEKEMHIPTDIQRWIIGKQLAVDLDKTVNHYNDGDFEQPMFLYLVAPAVKPEAVEKPSAPPLTPVSSLKPKDFSLPLKSAPIAKPESFNVTMNSPSTHTPSTSKLPEKDLTSNHYLELVNLDNLDVITNVDAFDCPICMMSYKAKEGVVLRDCLHTFCTDCLANTIKFCEEVEIKCPYRDEKYSCQSVLQEREIKALVSKDVFEQHLAKSVAVAESSMKETFHCKTVDCKGWCIYENTVNYFRCPICKWLNCLTCQAIHEGENCRQYQDRLKQVDNPENADGQRTRQMLEEMCSKGDAMICPSCQVVLMKKWGCDWLKCSMCKTEICWVTRGPRWGPAGKGDTSGGCQCGVNGVRCHPKCNYCH